MGLMTAPLTSIRKLLLDRRQALLAEVNHRVRASRGVRHHDVEDSVEASDTAERASMDLALLQMKTEALAGIEAALGRLGSGAFGTCVECDDAIGELRLRAVPFALRCRPCQQQLDERSPVSPSGSLRRFEPDTAGR